MPASEILDLFRFSGSFSRVLNYLEFKLKLFTTADAGEVKLPELTGETQRRPPLIEIGNELESDGSPKIGQTDVSPNRLELDLSVKRKRSSLRDETGKRITVEMIAVRWIGGPIRIRIV